MTPAETVRMTLSVYRINTTTGGRRTVVERRTITGEAPGAAFLAEPDRYPPCRCARCRSKQGAEVAR